MKIRTKVQKKKKKNSYHGKTRHEVNMKQRRQQQEK